VDALGALLDDLGRLVAQLPVAVYVCEAPGGELRFFNPRAVELWGRRPAPGDTEQRFCGAFRLFRADGRALPHAETPMAEVLQDGVPRQADVVIERPDGSRVAVHVAIAPLRDGAGRLVGAVNVFQDITARTLAEDALRLSEARYREIVEHQLDLVSRVARDGTLTYANEAYARYFGRRPEDIVGASYGPIVYPEDLPRLEAALASLEPAHPVVVIEHRVVRGDGAVRWVQWTNRALHDASGALVEIQSAGRDVTERKQAEEDAARLAAIVASADDAIVSKTLVGTIRSWNRAAERMFGWTAGEAVGQSILLIVPKDRADEEADILSRLKRGETIEQLETVRLTRDGRRLPVSITVSPVRDASGRVTAVSTIARDITAQKRVQVELRAHVQELETLYRLADLVGRARSVDEICEAAADAVLTVGEASRSSVLVLDAAGVMRFRAWRGLSASYRALVEGHSPWAPEARDPAPLLVPDVLADPALAPFREAITAEGIRALGFIPLVHHGRLLGKFMVYHDAPHEFAPAELRQASAIAHHVAFGLALTRVEAEIQALLRREREARADADAARAAAERTSRAKDEFLAMLAHELRNPLSVVVNALAVVDAAALDAAPARARLIMRRQVEHLARLLDDLLDVARITRGRIALEREPVSLRAAVEQAAEAYRPRIEAKGQRLAVVLPDGSATVTGDPVRLQQVLGNLLDNAWKYTQAGGSIQVALAVEHGDAVVRVRDDGAGVPPDQLESIFELFSQANPTLARTEGGLGIGLTLVRQVVDLHGGRVRARSEGRGHGTEVEVRIPLAAVVAAPEDAAAPTAPARRRVLVVEDHDDGRDMLATTLGLHGHEVVAAATGAEALALAERGPVDVALVDIGLPDLDGYEVARHLRRRFGARLRLVALTGYGQPADRERAVAAGFDEHVVKPVDPARLATLLGD
jgi:PAS domain S-box-containing protein